MDVGGGSWVSPGLVRGSAPHPPTPFVDRPRLLAKMQRVPAGGICLITAPSGFGASTALARFAQLSPVPVAWVAAGLAGPPREELWRTVLRSLSAAGVAAPDRVAASTGWQDVADALEHAGPGLVLVLDDVDGGQYAAEQRDLQHLLEALPPSVRVMVRSHGPPWLDVSTMLVRGRLVIIDQNDLRLDPQQGISLVGDLAPALPASARQALVDLAEGWAAALVAAIRCTDGHEESGPAGWLLDAGLPMLIGPELERLPDRCQDLIVTCSMLDVLTPDGCDAVRGTKDSGRVLARVEGEVPLLSRPDPRRPGIRLHPLLRRYARHQLAARGTSEERAALLRAASWLESVGDIEGAISNCFDAGEITRGRDLLRSHLTGFLGSGRTMEVHLWYQSTEAGRDASDELLLLGEAWACLLVGDIDGARHAQLELFDVLHRHRRERRTEKEEWIRPEIGLLTAELAVWSGQLEGAFDALESVRTRWEDEWTRAAHARSSNLDIQLRLWSGDLQAAHDRLVAARARPRLLTSHARVTVPSLKALLSARDGGAYRARALADEVLAWLEEHRSPSVYDDLDARLAHGWASLDLGDVDVAAEDFDSVQAKAARLTHTTYDVLGRCGQARVAWASGEHPRAWAVLESARVLAAERGAGRVLRDEIDRAEAVLRWAAGETPAADRMVERLRPTDPGRRTLAALTSEDQGALRHVLRHPLSVRDRCLVVIRSATLGSTDGSERRDIERASEVAVEHGLLRLLAESSPDMRLAVRTLARTQPDSAMATLSTMAEAAPRRTSRLSPGEDELMLLLQQGLTNEQIAQRLHVSVNTVKTRLRRLYKKLGVNGRHAALAVTFGRE